VRDKAKNVKYYLGHIVIYVTTHSITYISRRCFNSIYEVCQTFPNIGELQKKATFLFTSFRWNGGEK